MKNSRIVIGLIVFVVVILFISVVSIGIHNQNKPTLNNEQMSNLMKNVNDTKVPEISKSYSLDDVRRQYKDGNITYEEYKHAIDLYNKRVKLSNK